MRASHQIYRDRIVGRIQEVVALLAPEGTSATVAPTR